jgi:hypothetical protein
MAKQSKKNEELLNLLNSRLSLSRKFHQKHKKEVEKALEDYEIKSFDKKDLGDLHNKLHIPYIFTTVESGLPSIFSEMPDLLITQGGQNDQAITAFVNKVWDHIARITDVEEVVEDSGFMFLLTGQGAASYDWQYETETVEEIVEEPLLNEFGEPVFDEEGNPTMVESINSYEVPYINKPYFKYIPYNNIYFAPDSKFTVFDWDNDKIPYVIYKETLDVDEVEHIYEVTDIDPDEDLDMTELADETSYSEDELKKDGINKSDIEKVAVYTYTGKLPKDHIGKGWRPRSVYKVVFTRSRVLSKEPELVDHKYCVLCGNYGSPELFYRFGEAKALRELEQDISYGRSMMSDYRDRLATKIAVPETIEFDEDAFRSPRQFQVVRFLGDKYPQFITPPPVPEVVLANIQLSKEEIQMASGQFDLSQGQTQSVVDTATGQKIFAESYERRVERKRNKLAKFLKALALNILEMSTQYWTIEDYARITDMDAEVIEQGGYIEKLSELKSMYDVYIDTDLYGASSEARKSQAIAMWREMQDNPRIDQEELLRNVFKIGFEEKDVERFLSGEMTPEELIRALEYMMEIGLLPEEIGQQLLESVYQAQEQALGGDRSGVGGRPAVQNPDEIVQDQMPGSDDMQMQAQADAAYKQSGVERGPQNV